MNGYMLGPASRCNVMRRVRLPESGASKADRVRAAGERARAEAQARRTAAQWGTRAPREIGGADGPEPTRFGDWEAKGRASDF
jgi:hypothetical protein